MPLNDPAPIIEAPPLPETRPYRDPPTGPQEAIATIEGIPGIPGMTDLPELPRVIRNWTWPKLLWESLRHFLAHEGTMRAAALTYGGFLATVPITILLSFFAWKYDFLSLLFEWVQQEERLGLVTSTAQGRPVLMAEHFTADTAWSLVALHPTGSPQDRGVLEPALAGRVYQRNGALDSYGFARLGARNGASVGAALAWVAGDALELHGSLRYLSRADSKAINPATNGLVTSNPWRSGTVDDVTQLLVGGTWTHESQLSLLAEAWWVGSAMSDAQWDAWGQRNTQLTNLSALGAPASAVAGNLAWQADAFGVSPNLRRNNVLMRVSWQNGPWTPTLDVLYSPADQGRVVTAALSWQGDRVQVQGGVRNFGGPDNAVAAQLAARNVAYITTTWTF